MRSKADKVRRKDKEDTGDYHSLSLAMRSRDIAYPILGDLQLVTQTVVIFQYLLQEGEEREDLGKIREKEEEERRKSIRVQRRLRRWGSRVSLWRMRVA